MLRCKVCSSILFLTCVNSFPSSRRSVVLRHSGIIKERAKTLKNRFHRVYQRGNCFNGYILPDLLESYHSKLLAKCGVKRQINNQAFAIIFQSNQSGNEIWFKKWEFQISKKIATCVTKMNLMRFLRNF